MLRRSLVSASLLATLVVPVSAQVDLTSFGFVPSGGASYTTFTVTGAGTFDIWTTSILGTGGVTPFDPEIWLFSGAGTGGTALASDDDGCFTLVAQCGSSVSWYNSILNNIFLGVGTYTVAVGVFDFSEAEARAGTNGEGGGGDYALRISSLGEFIGTVPPGDASLASTVPEPATMTLLATGLMGMAAARRKRRTS